MTKTTERRAASDVVSTEVATVEEIRAHFPALERVHGGFPVAYFDGPGGTQVPRVVVDAMTDYLLRHNANTHWLYPTSEETDALIQRSREALADFLSGQPDEISFGQNMTTITFHLARGLARGWKAGDEIIVTELDHHANVAPWVQVARDHGFVIKTVRLNPADGRLSWDDLDRALGPRTKLLALGAASNALGTITDIRSATEMAHAVGALSFIDAVHYAAHEPIDVQLLGCDFLACSAYKFYGPHIGVLYGKREVVERIDIPKLLPAPDTSPERLETGTQNHEGIVGAGAAVEFLASLAREALPRRHALGRTFNTLHRRGSALIAMLWNGLRDIDGVTLYGPQPGTPRTPTLAFTMRGRSTNDVAIALAKRGLFVSNGDFYAQTVVERLGQAHDGLVRVGCSCYTTTEEVERLIEAVREL
jgi:cysteine desulfurase family protein (TIGR01976 family)